MNRFPVDTVKIDRSFIKGLDDASGSERNHKTSALIEAIVGLSRKLNLNVIAEGIECEAQLDRLIDIDVETGQGFLFGKAQPLDAFLALQPQDRPEIVPVTDLKLSNTG